MHDSANGKGIFLPPHRVGFVSLVRESWSTRFQRGFNAVSWLDSWLWTFSWLTMSPWIDPTIESPSGQNGLILTVHALGFSMDGGSIPSLVLFFDLSLAAAAKRTHLVLLCPLLYYCREASVFRCSTIFPRSLHVQPFFTASGHNLYMWPTWLQL